MADAFAAATAQGEGSIQDRDSFEGTNNEMHRIADGAYSLMSS